MKILFKHEHILPVLKYGGIERILFWHMKELVKLGHQVFLIGHPQSKVEKIGVKLIKCHDFNNWENLIPESIDIVHLFYSPSRSPKYPLIVSMGCNGQLGELFHPNSVFVSRKHAENHGSTCFVYNGIDFDEYPCPASYKKNNWQRFAFLAKGSWKVKNLKQTIKACKKSQKYLEILGGRSFWPSRYIKGHGLVDNSKKIVILRKCDALIFAVRWHEPFGIAMIEAMSQGLPVIGSAYGSLPEIIDQNVGVICQNFKELIITLSTPLSFNPEIIREYAKNKFSIQNFTRDYIKLYQKVIDGENLNPRAPTWSLSKAPQDLLPF